MSEKLVIAVCPDPHRPNETIKAEVVNPRDWFGKTWLLFVSYGMGGTYYVVEADNLCDAIDKLAESQCFGHEIAIAEEDFANYGLEVRKGDRIGGVEVEADGWLNLTGKWFAEQGNLAEHQISGNGVAYDGDHLYYWGEENCRPGEMPYKTRYFHPDLPEEGIPATEFFNEEYADVEWNNEDPKSRETKP